MISCVVLTRNRAAYLRMCLKAIAQNTKWPHEIIVVDNGSTDGTIDVADEMYDKGIITKFIYSDNRLGVCARNFGFKSAQGEIIAQIDDDVVMHPGWDSIVIDNINGSVGAVGVQGANINPDWSGFGGDIPVNGLCDVLTGFCWAFKNEGWLYDESFAPFWHEESELQLRMTIEKGYKKKRIPMICSHNCQRRDQVDWEVHDRNLNTIKERYRNIYVSERDRL